MLRAEDWMVTGEVRGEEYGVDMGLQALFKS